MNNAIVCAGLVLALFSISLTGACVVHYGGELVRRWRTGRANRRKWMKVLR